MRKRHLIIVGLMSALFLNLGCTKEENFEFPIVQTGDVVEVTEEGVVFHGKIMNLGNEEILEYGFVWDSIKSGLSINYSFVKSMDKANLGVYQYNLDSGLKSDQDYYVRAFMRNKDIVSYGRTVSFRSLGSRFPLTSIGPWTSISKYPSGGGDYSGSFTIGNKAYVGVGSDGIDLWEYEPQENVWKKKMNILRGRIVANFATLTKGYFLTRTGLSNYYQLYQYDPINDIWTVRAGGLNGQNIISGFSIANKGYIVTKSYIYEYTESADSWKIIMTTPTEMVFREGKVFGFLIDGKCYIVAAIDPLSRARIYGFDPDIQSIHVVADLPKYFFSNAFEIEGKIYLASSTHELVEYDPHSGRIEAWTFPPFHRRINAVSFSLGNKGYIGLGKGHRKIYGETSLMDDIWEFNKSKLD